MDNICQICNCKFPNLKSLHIHISRREKIKLENYYPKYYPRKDLYTLYPIEYKDYEQYFFSSFSCRKNMSKWFENNQDTTYAKELSLKLINDRISLKQLKWAPSEVELRSCIAPSIVGLEKIHQGSYLDIIQKPSSKFIYNNINLEKTNRSLTVLIDTREQQPFQFKGVDSKIAKLDVGDYTAEEPLYDDVFIERKSVNDFFSTFGVESQVERFKKELKRAVDYGMYLFVIVEKSIEESLSFYSSFSSNKYLTEFTFFNVREIMQKFDNCQFLFASNKIMAEELTLNILTNGQNATKYDWQYLIDKRIV